MKSFYAVVAFALIAVACGGVVDQDTDLNDDVPSDDSFEPTGPEGTGGSTSDDSSDDWDDNVPDETGGRQATPSTGGHSATGGSLPSNPATGGSLPSNPATGGVVSSTGGHPATGGMLVSTGGSVPEETGGHQSNAGAPSIGGALQPEAAGSAGAPSVSNEGGAGGEGEEYSLLKIAIRLAEDTPQTGIVTPGNETLFTKYIVSNPNDHEAGFATMILHNQNPDGSNADFASIRLSDCQDGGWEQVLLPDCNNPDECHFPDDDGKHNSIFTSFPLSEQRFMVPAQGSVPFCIYAIPAEVQPSSVTDPNGARLARSGDTPNLRIGTAITSDADAPDIQAPYDPPFMVLRKSVPDISWEEVDEPLHDGINTIARLTIFGDGEIDVEGFNFSFEYSPELTVEAGDINVFVVDGEEIPQKESPYFTNCAGLASFLDFSGMAWLCFPHEDRFVTQEMIVELRAMVSGVRAGSSITTRFYRNDSEERARTFLGLHLEPPGALWSHDSSEGVQEWGFYWSDLAAGDDHRGYAYSEEYMQTSGDFTNEYLVPGADGSSTVTAP